MMHACLVLMFAIAQDVPTPGGDPALPPPPKGTPVAKGTAGSIGLGTGKASAVGQSKGESAALGLRTRQDVSGTEQGEVHAIAEVAPYESAVAPKQSARLVYGFCAVTDEWLPDSSGRYLRGELYLYRPGTKKNGGTRDDKTPNEDFYHAVVESGRIVEEAGDRNLLREFSGLGVEAWRKPFERLDLEKLKAKLPVRVSPNRTVIGILSQVVDDLVKGERGRAAVRFKDRTKIWRDDGVQGAEGIDQSGN